MVTTLIVLIVLVAILLIIVVLGQNSKGGTFASNFSASNQLIGVKKTGDLLEKLTWGFAIGLMVLCLAVTMLLSTPEKEFQGTPATRGIGQGLPSGFEDQSGGMEEEAPMAPEGEMQSTDSLN
jgi:preprotein translocase subunit SecG